MYEKVNNLLKASKCGDLEAVEDLLNQLKPLILSSIRRYYNRGELYDDLIQEGYEVILLAIDSYDPERGVYFLGYIKMQLKYHYLNKHKERKTFSVNKVIDNNGTEWIDLIPDGKKEILEIIVNRERSLALLNSLSCLTERQREIVLDFYVDDLSIGEIGEKLGLAYRTIVNTKTKALKKLKNEMVK